MDFELRQAKEKWEREQKEKKERARRERERERKAREEAAKRQQAIEAAHSARRLEEAAASLAAQQREEEDLLVGDGVAFDRVLRALPMAGSGDKIRLPPSAFGELSSQNAIDKGPMFFEISVDSADKQAPRKIDEEEEERKRTHCGVLEFVAEEGTVELPPHVWQNAGLADASPSPSSSLHGLTTTNARVRYVRLPKGTYAKFRAEGLDFGDVPNHKAVLETKLRQHASLSVGDLLTVHHAGVDYGLRVMELRPSSSVSVLETDMEADVVGGVIDSSSGQKVGSSAQSRLVPLELGKSLEGVVSEGMYAYFKFNLDAAVARGVSAGDLDVLVHLDVVDNVAGAAAAAADADIYVGAHPMLFPTQHNHEWSSHEKGSKVVVLSSSGRRPVTASTYSVGVHGYFGDAHFQISVEARPSSHGQQQANAGQRVGKSTVPTGSSNQMEDGFSECGNCRQMVPAGKKVLHEAYCYRHNALCKHPNCGVVLRKDEMERHVHCSKCGQALKREELEKHLTVFHKPLQCGCGEVLEMEEMVTHRATKCPLRSVTCRYCGDMVQAGAQADNIRDRLRGLTSHESSCGSRTAPCDSCGRSVMLKEMDLHKEAAHGGSSPRAAMDLGTPPRPGGRSLASTPPRSSATDGGEQTAGPPPLNRGVQCPICDKQFGEADATWRLNEHVDRDHLAMGLQQSPPAAAAAGPTANMDMDLDRAIAQSSLDNVPPAFSNRVRTLSVSCPICGMAVHSERDLSSHIDMVH